IEDAGSPFPSEYLLQTTLRRFDADYTGGGTAPTVYVVLEALVGRRDGREVIGSFVATGNAAATANRQAAVVGAFEEATAAALEALATQTLQAVRNAPQPVQKPDRPAPSSSRPNQ